MRKLSSLFGLLLFCLFASAAPNDTIYINKQTQKVNLQHFTTVLSDSSKTASIESVRKQTAKFQICDDRSFNFGLSEIVHWFKIIIKNTDTCTVEYIYAYNYAPLNYIDFYDFVDNKIVKQIKTGELKPLNTRDIQHRFFLLKIVLKPGETHSVYLRVNSEGDSAVIPIELSSIQTYLQKDGSELLFCGIILGVFTLILIFTIFYLISTRDIISALFGGYVVCIFISMLYIDGFLKQFFITDSNWILDRLLYWLMAFSVFFLGMFAWYFLKLKQYWSQYKYLFGALITIQAVGVILCFFSNPIFYYGLLTINLTAPIVLIFILIGSIYSIQNNYKPAIILLLSALIPGTGVVIFFLRDYGFDSLNFFTEKEFKLAYTLDIMLLLVGVIYRVKSQQKEAALAIQQKNIEADAQRKQIETAKLELKRLSITTQKTQNSIALFDVNGKIEWCNEGFLRLYGFNENEALLSVTIFSLYSNEMVSSYMDVAQAKDESVQFESLFVTKEQKKIWVQTTLSPLFNEETKEHQFIAIDSDISSLKTAQQELIIARDNAEEANRLKTAFLSNITHEIRTPLNSIIGFSQLLSIREYPLEKQQKFLQMITTNGNHLLDIISDIIDISKIEAGRMELRPKVFPLNDMLLELVDQYSLQLQNKTLAFQAGIHERDVKIVLEMGLDNEASIIFTDQQRLKQVIINLMTNALKFTPSGTVTLGYNKRENEVSDELMFFIRDTGIGMSEDELRIIFQRFRQGNEAVSQHYGGTGLGLSISKGLIDLMGGAIWLESKKNRGTTVYFSVPYIKANTQSLLENANVSHRFDFTNKTILVVEDEFFNFNVIKEILDETHSTIIHAETGAQAFEIMESNRKIDLILMDIRLPDISGYEVTRKIRLSNKLVPVIAQTAYATEDVRYLCMKSGCNDYIAKPINPNYMLHLIAKYLKQ